eukprot:647725_1
MASKPVVDVMCELCINESVLDICVGLASHRILDKYEKEPKELWKHMTRSTALCDQKGTDPNLNQCHKEKVENNQKGKGPRSGNRGYKVEVQSNKNGSKPEPLS